MAVFHVSQMSPPRLMDPLVQKRSHGSKEPKYLTGQMPYLNIKTLNGTQSIDTNQSNLQSFKFLTSTGLIIYDNMIRYNNKIFIVRSKGEKVSLIYCTVP